MTILKVWQNLLTQILGFTTVDNVLFSKNMLVLILYPIRIPNETYTVPESVTTIKGVAFTSAIYLKEIASELQNLHPEAQIWVDENNGTVRQLTG